MNFTVNLLGETNDFICSNNDEKLRAFVKTLRNISLSIYDLWFLHNSKSPVTETK